MIHVLFDEVATSPEALPQFARIESQWIESALLAALCTEGRTGDASVLLTDAFGMQSLNRDYRNVDAVTDVLTFPAWEGASLAAPPDGYLGDIAICVPRAMEQAEAYGHSLKREIMFLTIHGALHLLGYDHMQPEEEATMFAKQEKILIDLGVTR